MTKWRDLFFDLGDNSLAKFTRWTIFVRVHLCARARTCPDAAVECPNDNVADVEGTLSSPLYVGGVAVVWCDIFLTPVYVIFLRKSGEHI